MAVAAAIRTQKCCRCLDTANVAVGTALACHVATLTLYTAIVFTIIYWYEIVDYVKIPYVEHGYDPAPIDIAFEVTWWTGIVAMNLAVLYFVVCNIMVTAVIKEKPKRLLPWIVLTTIFLPLCVIFFTIQFAVGVLAGWLLFVLAPAAIGLLWCLLWLVGYFCVYSHYQLLTGDVTLEEEEDLEAAMDV